jgi:hypothetical protein
MMDIIQEKDDGFGDRIYEYNGFQYADYADARAAQKRQNLKNKRSPEALAEIRSSIENSVRQRRFEAGQGSKPDPIYHEIEIALMALDSPTEPDRSRIATRTEITQAVNSFFLNREKELLEDLTAFFERVRQVPEGNQEAFDEGFFIEFDQKALILTNYLKALVDRSIADLPEGESIEQYKKRLKREDAAYQAALERYEKEVEKIEAPLRAHEQRLEAEIQREVDFEMSQIMKG